MICPNCNAQVSDSMNFCENCGAALPKDNAPQQDFQSFDAQQPSTQSPGAQDSDQWSAAQSYDDQQSSYSSPYAQQPYEAPQYAQQPYDAQQTGGSPTPPGVYAGSGGSGAGASAQVSVAPFVLAIIALVTSLLGLFPVSIILAIIALVMNSGQKKRGEFSSKQTPTTIMSVISLVISVIFLILTIMVGGFVMAYLASGGVDVSTGKDGKVSISAHVSSSSAQSQSASSSSAAGSAAADSASSSASASSQDSPSSEITDKLAGSWKLTRLVSDGEVANPDDIAIMESMGLTVALDINADGTATLVLFGVHMSGPWECSDGTNVRFVLSGGAIDATVDGNTLTMTEGTDVYTFVKQ